MNVSYLCSRLGHRSSVVRVDQWWDEAGETEPPPLTIALEREEGTPIGEVAREVGARLGWPVYDRELLELVGRELRVPASHLKEMDERHQNWLVECLQGFTSTGVSETLYVHRLVSVVRGLAVRGQCVIVGRGAAHILPPASTLRVRLVATAADRIAALSRRLHLPAREAARKVAEISKERMQFIRDHFHRDPAAPGGYDLILNTSQWSAADCAALVEQAIHYKRRSAVDDVLAAGASSV